MHSELQSSELLQRLIAVRNACSHKDTSPYCSYRFLDEQDLRSGRYELQELMRICLRCQEVELASQLPAAQVSALTKFNKNLVGKPN